MLAWAADHLPLHTGDILPAGLSLAAAGEHTTFFDAPSQRWIKLTRPGLYGAQAQDAGAYLQRWALFNRVFGDDVRIEGMVMLPGEDDYRMVISQPDAPALNPAAPAASVQQVEEWLPSKGFEPWEGEWIHPVTGLRVWDLGNANAILTAQGIRPVDIQIEPAKTDMLRRLRSTRPTGQTITGTLHKATTAPGIASRAYHAVENFALNTLEGSFSAGSALTRATGLQSPLQKLGWNNLDRAASAKLAALTRWTDGRTGATQTVAKWTGAAPQKLKDAAHALQREFFPDSVLPREILAKKREMEIKTAMGGQRAMDLVRALSKTPAMVEKELLMHAIETTTQVLSTAHQTPVQVQRNSPP
ncbi:MAG: hypothetical protein JNM65_06790 [Verrucomicrobiaceae bacterium]|nr:hypothetical protein [Verrucomicrobiaceae bacterium]